MSIIGINREKCTNCKNCITDCVTLRFDWDARTENVVFHEDWGCILCGHCVAICPVDAIRYEDKDGKPYEFEEIKKINTLVPYEALYKLMRSKRSIRHYKKELVPKTELQKVLDAMRHAPTGVNIRTLKCTVISGEKKVQQLSNAIQNALLASLVVSDENKLGFRAKLNLGRDPIFHKAPHVIIFNGPELEYVNATITITYGMLAAETLGLGSCWIGWAQGSLNSSTTIKEDILGITDKVSGVFTIGYPDVRYNRCPTRPELQTTWLNGE